MCDVRGAAGAEGNFYDVDIPLPLLLLSQFEPTLGSLGEGKFSIALLVLPPDAVLRHAKRAHHNIMCTFVLTWCTCLCHIRPLRDHHLPLKR